MERIIEFSELEATVADVYKRLRRDRGGACDSRCSEADGKRFAIAVMLPDGSMIAKGDTEAAFALGEMSQIPVAATLMQNTGGKELLRKIGITRGEKPAQLRELASLTIQPRLLRAISAIEPTGDPDGKMKIVGDMLAAMAGSEPQFDDRLYKALGAEHCEFDGVELLARCGFRLCDDPEQTLDIASRLFSLCVNVKQLAAIGGTLLSDGVNPLNETPVIETSVAERIVAAMAAFGPARQSQGWLVGSGVPAMASVSGGMLGILPGTMAIAAYSPSLNEKGFSVRASHAIRHIASSLGLSAFSSTHAVIRP